MSAREPNIVHSGLVFSMDAANQLSYVSGDTTTSDMSNQVSGTLTNGVDFSDGSFDFDGVNDYIDYGDNSFFELQDFTIDTWVNFSVEDALQYFVIMQWQVATVGGKCGVTVYRNTTNEIHFFMFTAPDTNNNLTGSVILTNTWYNITATKVGTDYRLYINGELDNSSTLASATVDYTTSTPKRTRFGGGNDRGLLPPEFPFGGSMGNVNIYNRALSADEVLNNYEALKYRFI